MILCHMYECPFPLSHFLFTCVIVVCNNKFFGIRDEITNSFLFSSLSIFFIAGITLRKIINEMDERK